MTNSKHNRERQLQELLTLARQAINDTPPDKQSPLINTANRLSRELWELQGGAPAAASPTEAEENDDVGTTIFLQRMRERRNAR
nr:MAG TPA: hypothetical protein [Bacteriophage sp.]